MREINIRSMADKLTFPQRINAKHYRIATIIDYGVAMLLRLFLCVTLKAMFIEASWGN